MKSTLVGATAALSIALASSASAQTIHVEITNVTHGSWFTPLLVVAHRPSADVFEVGSPASEPLERMAEAGDISDLQAMAESMGATTAVANDTPLGPGESASATLRTRDNRMLSIVSMLLPSNDAFLGLDAFPLRKLKKQAVVYLGSYDAGTEANDELLVPGAGFNLPGAPGDPGGNAGSGGVGMTNFDPNTRVHVHPGPVGDSDPTGGPSDFDSALHRWQDPVAKVVITRVKDH